MAKQCCVCGKSIGFMEGGTPLGAGENYACTQCYEIIADYWNEIWNTESVDQIEAIKKKADEAINFKAQDLRNPQILRDYLFNGAEKKRGFIADRQEKAKAEESFVPEEDIYLSLRKKLILSTSGTLEGYKVKKQLGIVFGETVFKPSASQSFHAFFGDMFRELSFSAKEMTGEVGLIEEARKFAYIKMMKAAVDLGANAIIAIETDNTIGSGIYYLSLYGTAVYVEPEE